MTWVILCCVILTFSLPLTISAASCDVSRGEVYLGNRHVQDFAACEQACKDDANCASITYYTHSGSCDFFKTSCKATSPGGPGVTKFIKEVEALNGKECDNTQGELWLSGGQETSLAACKQSCEDEPQCQSITYYNHGACSHFSTKCEKTRPASNAHTERIKDFEEEEETCEDLGTCDAHHGEECDVNQAEIYMSDGSGQVANYEACKKACTDRVRCQSITFYAHGWCSLFKTKCTHRRPVDNGIAQNLKDDVFNQQECDTSKGEHYLGASSGNRPDFAACKQSCLDESSCKSVTYFLSGFCSHFSTCCTNRKPSPTGSADSLKLPICDDPSPCNTNNGGCDSKRTCNYADGKVTCGDCSAGYINYGTHDCQDEDPCKRHGGNGGCDPKRKCINTNGVVSCGPCPPGYKDVGKNECTEVVDPCLTNNGGCDAKRACTNTNGVATCGDCPAPLVNDGATGCKEPDPCLTNNGGCDARRKCTSANGKVTCGHCASGYYNYGATGCRQDPCKRNNGGCHKQRRCTSKGAQVRCGTCARGYYNNGAKGCKGKCVKQACREHNGASPNRPGVGQRDPDCCGNPGTTGCDHGYVHSIVRGNAEWSKLGGRPAGFATCTAPGLAGNTCCSKA